MNQVTAPLIREHGVLVESLRDVAAAYESGSPIGASSLVRFLQDALLLHRRREEDILFPALVGRIEGEIDERLGLIEVPAQRSDSWIGARELLLGLLASTIAEHQHLATMLASLDGRPTGCPADARSVRRDLRYLMRQFLKHTSREQNQLYPLAEAMLSNPEKRRLRSRMDACTAPEWVA